MKRAASRASVIERKLGRKPTLAIIGAADADGRRFVELKQRRLANLRMNIEPYWLAYDDTTDSALDVVAALNGRRDVDAVFLQFPLPGQIDGSQLANAIDPRKDIDCSGAVAEAQFLRGQSVFTPVAPLAASELLRDELGSLRGWRIVIAGNDDPFTGGLTALLRRADAIVETTHAAGPMMAQLLRHADALVVSDKLPDSATLAEIEWLVLLLDAGYYLRPRPHDWIPPDVAMRIGTHMRQYGNVGPLTVAHIAQVTVKAAARTTKDVAKKLNSQQPRAYQDIVDETLAEPAAPDNPPPRPRP